MPEVEKFKHRRYRYGSRLLSAFEIADVVGKNRKSLHKMLLNAKVKDGDEVTYLVNAMGTKGVSDAEKTLNSQNNINPGIRESLTLEMLRISLDDEYLLESSKGKVELLAELFGLSGGKATRTRGALNKFSKDFHAFAVKGNGFEDNSYLALIKGNSFFGEVADIVGSKIAENGLALTSEVMDVITTKYGAKNNIKDAVRATLNTMSSLGVINKEVLHRRNSSWTKR